MVEEVVEKEVVELSSDMLRRLSGIWEGVSGWVLGVGDTCLGLLVEAVVCVGGAELRS